MQNEIEPHDNRLYQDVLFDREILQFYLESTKYYEELLKENVATIENDKDLAFLLEQPERNEIEIYRELRRVTRVREIIQKKIDDARDPWEYEMSIYHKDVRFLKSVGLLYIQHLRNRRNVLSTKPKLSKHALSAVDQKLSYYEEKTNIGIFKTASTSPLLVDELVTDTEHVKLPEASNLGTRRPQPILIDSIEILDPELKLRCLDLFHSFQEDGQYERLDTVVAEATRILEDKLRLASGAPSDCVGVELASFAFGSKDTKLIVSNLPAEQEAAHLLFRGAFGFIRNHVHHHLVKNLSPERVLQIVGMIDYLIFLTQDAKRQSTKGENGG